MFDFADFDYKLIFDEKNLISNKIVDIFIFVFTYGAPLMMIVFNKLKHKLNISIISSSYKQFNKLY